MRDKGCMPTTTPPASPYTPETELQRRLRERMAAMGLNPFSAAKKAGLHPDYVRNILRGKAKQPSAERLAKLAEALEVSLPYLMGEPDLGPPPPEGYDYSGAPYSKYAPAGRRADEAGTEAVLLPIKHELLTGAFRRAPETVRALGFEAATIPAAYRDRENWYEIVRDDGASLVAPMGSLLHVAKFTDDDRNLLGEGDVVIVERHHIGPNASHYLIERSVRIIHRRYEGMGLWFFDYASADEEYWGISDDIFRDEKNPDSSDIVNASFDELSGLLASIEEVRLSSGIGNPERVVTGEQMFDNLKTQLKLRPRVVGKVVRALIAVDAKADFGMIPNA